MSYILDALKKAEAERRQEQVPGLHTQPLPVAPAAYRKPAWMRPALGGGIGLLAVLAGLLWWQPWRGAPANGPAVKAVAVAPATPAAPATPVVAPAAPAPAPTAAAAAASATRPAAEEPKAAPPAARKRSDPDKPKAKPEAAAKARAEERNAAPASEKPRAAPVPPEESIAALRDLPEAVQRAIPQMSVGGYIYADKPAGRSVLINKRLMREGDQVAPDLVLERMTPNGMVFNYKGTRFRTSY
jgi:general secretion pathway protein B